MMSYPPYVMNRFSLGRVVQCPIDLFTNRGTQRAEYAMRAAPANVWIKKGSRGLLSLYVTSLAARRAARKRRADADADAGPSNAEPSDTFVYIPLEPGNALWFAIPVAPGKTLKRAVSEILWQPPSEEMKDALRWFCAVMLDQTVSNQTISEEDVLAAGTRSFKRDLEAGGEMKNLINYCGDVWRDDFQLTKTFQHWPSLT